LSSSRTPAPARNEISQVTGLGRNQCAGTIRLTDLVVLDLHAARSAFATARRDAERWRRDGNAGDEVARERKRAEREGNKVGEAEYSRWIHTQGGGGVRLGTVRLVGQGAAGRPDSELALGWSHSVGSQN
jgi:hypothetical protein